MADQPVFAEDVDGALARFEVDPEEGLSQAEATRRLERHGRNELRSSRRRSAWSILLDQFKSVVLYLLLGAGLLAFAFGQWPEGVAIAGVLVVNAAIGFVSEYKAMRSMETLEQLSRGNAFVRREGRDIEIELPTVTVGDVVLVEAGSLVPADARLIDSEQLRVNEASLTGESVPANKTPEPVEPETPLADRTDMLYKGTTVVEGRAEAVVVATGMATELGRISELTAEAESTQSSLERRLNDLGARLGWITIVIAALIAGGGLLAGQPTILMIETAIALGVAAIPEGLPVVVTIALARGMWVMARRNALVNQLSAVETLGSTRVIFTDKTGTLTENRMTLRRIVTPAGTLDTSDNQPGEPGPISRRILEVGLLCNNAQLPLDDDEDAQGDPTEIALLSGGLRFDLRQEDLLADQPEVREESFDPDVMMMATFHRVDQRLRVAVKGAASEVLAASGRIADGQGDPQPMSDNDRQQWRRRSEDLAEEGLRVLAVAEKHVDDAEAEPYKDLIFLGLVGLYDPPAEGVREAIADCQRAGVRVVMVTGDHPSTGRAIGRQVGLDDNKQVMLGQDMQAPDELESSQRERILQTDVFARVSPEQKLRLITVYQQAGETVAMTGDGVNDTPALKKADIGVAMGRRGTDAARQVADIVLRDDRFSSIVAAIAQGRVIFGNIRKSAMFMLCTNVAEVLAVAIAAVAGWTLPLQPLQILYLNLLTDVLPALALGVSKGNPNVMDRPPRSPDEAVLTGRHWLAIAGWSAAICACVLSGLHLAMLWLSLSAAQAVTISFLVLGFSKLWFVFNLRDPGSSALDNDIVKNPWVWGAILLCISLLLAAVYLPGLTGLLRTRPPTWPGWTLVLALSLVPLALGQAIRATQREQREL